MAGAGGNGARALFKANFSGLSSRAQLVRARAAYTGRVSQRAEIEIPAKSPV